MALIIDNAGRIEEMDELVALSREDDELARGLGLFIDTGAVFFDFDYLPAERADDVRIRYKLGEGVITLLVAARARKSHLHHA
ncbi:MAG: hypothetical protein P4L83_09480 [Nevskia sp.]|nr:hypothetical protein [Nevskia sp.]